MYLVNSSQISVYVWVIVHYNYISSILCFLFKIYLVLLLLLLLLVMFVLNPNVKIQPTTMKCPLPLHTVHWTAKHLVADEDILRNPWGFLLRGQNPMQQGVVIADKTNQSIFGNRIMSSVTKPSLLVLSRKFYVGCHTQH